MSKANVIYDLIHTTTGIIPDIDKCIWLENNLCSNDIITSTEEEIKPIIEYLRSDPNTAYFVTDSNAAKIGAPIGRQLTIMYPNLEMNQFLSIMMEIWKTIVLQFAIDHGYTQK